MKKIKNFKTVLGVVIVGLTTLLPSCVQGDFSDLYDEELVWSNGIPRTKSGTDPGQSYDMPQCGVSCIAYITGHSTDQIVGYAANCDINCGSNDQALKGSQIVTIFGAIGEDYPNSWIGIDYTINGVAVENRSPMQERLNSLMDGTINIIVNLRRNHYVVGVEIFTSNNNKYIRTYDPQTKKYANYSITSRDITGVIL